MIINMTTIASRGEHYIGRTLTSLAKSDGRDLTVNLILGSYDTSHVEEYRSVANIVPWDAESQAMIEGKSMRRACTINAIRALRYGSDDYCLCCEDDIRFESNWLTQLKLTINQIERQNYVLILNQAGDQSPDRCYAVHTQQSLCGAQAIFYPTKSLRDAVADYVQENMHKSMNDVLIGRYAKEFAALYNTAPKLVHHIGGVSTFHGPGPETTT